MPLNRDNYASGFLVDDQLMAGVTEAESKGAFTAFVLRPETGEYLGYRQFADLDEALESINRIPREWKYEAAGGCGGCAEGKCAVASGGACRKKTGIPTADAECCPPSADV